ncbi:FAD-binding protein [Azoarcus sp. KH32C]|uniref:FAD-binding protein n=1 Tax=Azoarcus sp. KH32C TaxID=748247 RepID=UPI00023864FC|nr:FAD-binding protein [Azoarcus sp. KH32C]BAL24672.1 hypothetical protein AZKH_2366 [Azoarcus sp. KH32C]
MDRAPYYALIVYPAITFTFGGLTIDTGAQVLDNQGRAVPGLLAAGSDACPSRVLQPRWRWPTCDEAVRVRPRGRKPGSPRQRFDIRLVAVTSVLPAPTQ